MGLQSCRFLPVRRWLSPANMSRWQLHTWDICFTSRRYVTPDLRRFHLHAADFMSAFFPAYLDCTTRLWASTYPLTPVVGFLAAGVLLVACSIVMTARRDI